MRHLNPKQPIKYRTIFHMYYSNSYFYSNIDQGDYYKGTDSLIISPWGT